MQYHEYLLHAMKDVCISVLVTNEGLDGGSGIHYSLEIYPIIRLIKILGYSLK